MGDINIRGLIYSKYKSESDFARRLGWTRQKVNNVTSGRYTPNLYEAKAIAEALGVEFTIVTDIFFRQSSPIGDTEVS